MKQILQIYKVKSKIRASVLSWQYHYENLFGVETFF